MSKSLLLIVIIFLSFHSVSQIITVSGKVVDIKKNHIPYAHIADLSSNNIVVCNSSGSFSINIINQVNIFSATATY